MNSVVALHEAGHAVVAIRRGLKVDSVSIRPWSYDGSAGRCEFDQDSVPVDTVSDVASCAATLIAGELAVSRFWRQDRPFNWFGQTRDAQRARALLETYDDVTDMRRVRVLAEGRASMDLILGWESVLRLAHELERYRTISNKRLIRRLVMDGDADADEPTLTGPKGAKGVGGRLPS